MNKIRRNKINEATKLVQKVKLVIEEVCEEESEAYDNLNDGLQATMRGEQMYENITEMEECLKYIDNILECLDLID